MARDQLVFLVICGVAVVVAAVAVVHYFSGGSSKIVATKWQCLNCDREFKMKKFVAPPIECPKCDGQAVRLVYRTCPKCKAKVLASRVQRIGGAGAGGAPGMGGPMGMPPMQAQFWLKQPDGSYGWSDWMSLASPQARQIHDGFKCTECGASLSVQPAQPPPRTSRSR